MYKPNITILKIHIYKPNITMLKINIKGKKNEKNIMTLNN